MNCSAIRKNIFLIVSLALLLVMLIYDISDDIIERKTTLHILIEVVTVAMGLISVFSLAYRLKEKLVLARQYASDAKIQIESLRQEKKEWETKNLKHIQGLSTSIKDATGILRKANYLARGGLIAAATDKEQVVSAEHVRLASSELILH